MIKLNLLKGNFTTQLTLIKQNFKLEKADGSGILGEFLEKQITSKKIIVQQLKHSNKAGFFKNTYVFDTNFGLCRSLHK